LPLLLPTDGRKFVMNSAVIFFASVVDPVLNGKILDDVTTAFRAAYLWERAGAEKKQCDTGLRRHFAQRIRRMCSMQTAVTLKRFRVGPNPPKALDQYLETLALLTRQWRTAERDRERWWRVNRRDAARVQQALWDGAPEVVPFIDPKWPIEARRSAVHPDDVKLLPVLRLKRQRSLEHAAQTLAYRLFFELWKDPDLLGFCVRCGAPLEKMKKRYCGQRCGSAHTSRQCHRFDTRRDNLKRVRLAVSLLRSWFESNRRKPWRKFVEDGLHDGNLIEAESHGSQWLGRAIRATHAPTDGEVRRKFVEQCIDPRLLAEAESARAEVEALFGLIQAAEEYAR
jgi:hypothetical protein